MKLILTDKLIIAINNLNLKKNSYSKALSFIGFLMQEYYYNHKKLKLSEFIEIPSTKLRKLFTKDYNTLFLKQLSDNEIVFKDAYSNPKFKDTKNKPAKSYGYRINEKYLDFTSVSSIEYKKYETQSGKNKHKKELLWVKEDLAKIDFNIPLMIQETLNFNLDDFVELNDDITDSQVDFIINQNGKSFPVLKSMSYLRTKAAKGRLDIIKFRGEVYLEDYEEFKQRKEASKKLARLYAISRLESKDFYASRNDTNNRLDTNLTNLDKVFFEKSFITLDGEPLVEIDLKNAQPTFLCYIMNTYSNTHHPLKEIIQNYQFPILDLTAPDVIDFMQNSASGTLYEKIGEIGNWPRPIAKKIFIKIMFSSHSSSYQKMLETTFPGIIGWMTEFKKMNKKVSVKDSAPKSPLSNLLQKIESAIFIDDIYFSLKKQGFTVFSKHDCILCKASDRDEVKARVEQLLDGYGFPYKLS